MKERPNLKYSIVFTIVILLIFGIIVICTTKLGTAMGDIVDSYHQEYIEKGTGED